MKGQAGIPYASWDERVKAFRAPAIYYPAILEYLKKSGLIFSDYVQNLLPSRNLICKARLRGYQLQAIKAWELAGKRGIVVLPTGSGKTIIGLRAIEMVNGPVLIAVPTLALVDQWKLLLSKEFNMEVGVIGGGQFLPLQLTVSTYDSAYLRASELGNRFSLLIFDEVHHLAGEGYRQIAEMFTSPYRLGLTATYEREDMRHTELPRLVGGVVFRLEPKDLAGTYLSNYSLERINVELNEEERKEYAANYGLFRRYVMTRGIRLATPLEFRRFIMRTASDPDARRALLARNKAIDIAFNSEAKMKTLEEIIGSRPDERIIIFTQHNDLVYKISKRFLIPFITHTTNKDERKEVLSGFREGRFRAIVTSKVLDEGIDVPEASLGIIVSGTGSSREFIQRLGRLLRKDKGKEVARLIEIVSTNTSETRTSYRRRRGSTREGI